MNFAQVKQANGNNVTMLATFVEVGGVGLTQNQKQVCKCQLIDDNREQHLVRLYGTMPTSALHNMRQQFSLSSYQGTNQRGQPYTGFSGFWSDRAMVGQVPGNVPQAPSQPQQGIQQPAQAMKTPYNALHSKEPYQGLRMPDTYAYPVTPETADRMARAVCIEALLKNGQKPIYSYVTELVDYIRTGKEPIDVSNAPDPHPDITNQGICEHCGNPHEHCSCEPAF